LAPIATEPTRARTVTGRQPPSSSIARVDIDRASKSDIAAIRRRTNHEEVHRLGGGSAKARINRGAIWQKFRFTANRFSGGEENQKSNHLQ
jgi:hypothetical protein